MSTPNTINILQLYPKDMNIYGDTGNLITICKRLEKNGYKANVISYNVGDKLPDSVDMVIGGGGQDSGQLKIHSDLISISDNLKRWANDGVPMLVVCGLYQLFGESFKLASGDTLGGVGIFKTKTVATPERLIGNIVTESSEFGKIIGYENHSGQTYLDENSIALASVLKGAGNNLSDAHEGARYKNVIGTYLHGSLLPKNPKIADFLIKEALEYKFNLSDEEITLNFDDSLADKARKVAESRPR